MKNSQFFIAFLMVVLTGGLLFCALLAVEVFVLILLGFTYDSWQHLLVFLAVYSVIEYVLSTVLQRIIDKRVVHHKSFHKFWGQVLLTFVLIMSSVIIVDAIWMPTYGAVAYAIITSILYMIVERSDSKKDK